MTDTRPADAFRSALLALQQVFNDLERIRSALGQLLNMLEEPERMAEFDRLVAAVSATYWQPN